MSVWLFQEGDDCSHLYPDDDKETVAACGNELVEQCDHCGHDREVFMDTRKRHCSACLATEQTSGGEKP